ncbi:MAG: Aspartyl/glutamyl-tRNA(Asn/Gln) amidotransferase subunit B [Candidatus Roizmanbacteria bacterium GW2011_GWA2_37_7]|uniref:Aspartyl/glutamyl-tRNA(Asn/Gln) amidotransferase subunit B n=1 Tax=Candidatus Roizmanbacteria bacterium GW2011_GWA2_37_7 TaxID=1618481 RepID=A0A0G0KA12_9BACT|nr:MAG: Aspartyl/glutamyl-tRNA(Asn/Gln) amidotransferase subunit B [Candidatus Roizmanbacteria bacterium GW2011_GWA2_37_7]
MNKYTPVIGLEIHVELKTQSKMFCQCKADYFGKKPNTNTCPVCLGLPGALPVPNMKAVEWTIKIAQALNCTINKQSKFDRKHYFYPDLPKGYQISQYDEPLAVRGYLEIFNPKSQDPEKFQILNPKSKIHITRVHLEEDTGKLIHSGNDTLVDFNRSGVPLVEIVTEPDFDNADDVKIFLEELHTIIRYLEVSDANMEEGSMRLEPNISLARITQNVKRVTLPNYKVEVKNINSFNFVKKAIEYELKRQEELLNSGETPKQETRGYDDKRGITYSQRSKEEAHDYRYFPEPDIPPMSFTVHELETIKQTLPELPHEKVERYTKNFDLKYDDAFILTRKVSDSQYFESVNSKFKDQISKMSFVIQNPGQKISNIIVNKRISPNLSADEFVEKFIQMHKPVEVDTDKLEQVIADVIKINPKQVEQYKNGKTGLLGFFVGQVMKEMHGKADPQNVKELLRKKIEEK